MLSTISDKIFTALFRAKNSRDLAPALFNVVTEMVPNQFQVLVLVRESDHPQVFCSHTKYQDAFHRYIEGARGEEEVWIRCGLSQPEHHLKWKSESFLKKVTEDSILHGDFMKKAGVEHAVTFGTWKQNDWQACLMIFRTESQGTFSTRDMVKLQTFRPYFQSTVERVVGLGEEDLYRRALETFIWGLPSSAIVLSWDLKVLYYNASALELTECWREGLQFAHSKKGKTLVLPEDILTEAEREKTRLTSDKKSLKGTHKTFLLSEFKNKRSAELAAKVYFYPSQCGTLTKGTFLINLFRQSKVPDEQITYDSFASLSPRERDVVLLAANGKKSGEIAEQLGTASITVRMQLHSAYKKLGINTRYELVRMFSQGANSNGNPAHHESHSTGIAGTPHLVQMPTEPKKQEVVEIRTVDHLDPFFTSFILLANNCAEGIVLTNAEAKIVWFNPSFTQMTGYTLDDLKGQVLGECLIGEAMDTHTLNRFRKAALDMRACNCEVLYQKKDGRAMHVTVHLRPLIGSDGPMGGFATHQVAKLI